MLGHRGARHAHPENTLRAFQAALDEGALGTELDVRLCSDGTPVVVHDLDLSRVTGGRDARRVANLSASQLAAVRLTDEETIPRLEAVIEWARARGALLNIELKSERAVRDPIANIVADLLKGYSDAPHWACVSSFHPLLVRRFAELCPRVIAALLVSQNHPCLLSAHWLRLTGAHAVHPQAALLTRRPSLVERVPQALVNSWTVNDPEEARRLSSLGVYALISDKPGLIVRALGANSG